MAKLEYEYEKLIKVFKLLHNNSNVPEKEIYHIKNDNGYYECYQNGKIYKRQTKTGFCWNCGNKVN